MFTHTILNYDESLLENYLEEDSSSYEENNWEDNQSNLSAHKFLWFDIGKTSYTKVKLIKIFVGELFIPKQ